MRHPAGEAPCPTETQAVLDCCKGNPNNPIACWDMVAALDACARRARQQAASGIAPAAASSSSSFVPLTPGMSASGKPVDEAYGHGHTHEHGDGHGHTHK